MTPNRRRFLRLVGTAVLTGPATATLIGTSGGLAQTSYPERTVRILVGFAPGGPTDIPARVLANKLSDMWGKPVVIENVAGAGGNLATDHVAKATPDGYTLLMAASGMIVANPSLYPKLPFDPVRDLTPISQVVFTPNILVVHKDVPAVSIQDLIVLARAAPGKLTFGSGGVGTTVHLSGELFKFMAGIDIQHVPYRGVGPALLDLLGGRITMVFGTTANVLPFVREGKLRALAVTSLKRSPAAPDVPTMAESGFPGFDVTAWFGLMGPAGIAAAIVDKLHRSTIGIVAMPEVRAKFEESGMEVTGNSPAEFAAAIKREMSQWSKVITESGTKRAN